MKKVKHETKSQASFTLIIYAVSLYQVIPRTQLDGWENLKDSV